jgi:predicted secreted protein
MRIAIQADDGDEVSISADVISAEQALVTVTIENSLYSADAELESLTLTVEKARELAKALVSVADAVEFVNLPTEALNGMAEGALGDDRVVL